jgi:tungstate transport system substrate-binding protein
MKLSHLFKPLFKGFILLLLISSVSIAQSDCKNIFGSTERIFRLATGSPGELGLIEELATVFNGANGTTMCWIKAGSGKSLKLLKEKQVDIIMVHAPAVEKKAVKEGWAIKRTLIGSNEFYIVGPKDDPAHISSSTSAADAYARIAKAKVTFLSRGDNSGTNKKELSIWKTAGINPSGNWYMITKDFMMASLKKANKVNGYFMTDSSTWVAGKKGLDNIKVLFKGDPFLINTYHGLCQPEGATEGQRDASKFIDFLSSTQGQKIIRDYGKQLFGQAMYNDSAYARKYEH